MILAVLLAAVLPTMLLANSNLQLALAQIENQTSSAYPPPPPPGGPPPGGLFADPFSDTQAGTSTNETCTLTPSLIEVEGTPQQTQGPYFVDGMPNRYDLRSESSDGSIQDGIPLRLIINVYNVSGYTNGNTSGLCVPFSGAKVDIWEANPQGIYSGVAEDGTEGKDFLRGYQIVDDNGTVQFTTVYPGW